MQLPALIDGVIRRRYKRFLADVELADGVQVTAHCPNTGSMRTCWQPGARVQVSHSDNPRRKLAWTLERVDMGGGWIGVHTGRTNEVIGEGLRQGAIAALVGYGRIRSEVVCPNLELPRSRFDFLLTEGAGPDAWIEVKNVTLYEAGCLQFPDAVTARGRKHLEVLARLSHQGYRAVMIYALNRPEGSCFSPADAIDPGYGMTLRQVIQDAGVEVLALRIRHTTQTMEVAAAVQVVL
jgi:sugar fermentation stimulation protein A